MTYILCICTSYKMMKDITYWIMSTFKVSIICLFLIHLIQQMRPQFKVAIQQKLFCIVGKRNKIFTFHTWIVDNNREKFYLRWFYLLWLKYHILIQTCYIQSLRNRYIYIYTYLFVFVLIYNLELKNQFFCSISTNSI